MLMVYKKNEFVLSDVIYQLIGFQAIVYPFKLLKRHGLLIWTIILIYPF